MIWQRSILALVTIAASGLAAIAGIRERVAEAPHLLAAAERRLELAATRALRDTALARDDLRTRADVVANGANVGIELRTLRAQLKLVPAGTAPPERLLARIESTRALMAEKLIPLLDDLPPLSGTVIVDTDRLVLWSTVAGWPTDSTIPGESDAIASALAGQTAGGSHVEDTKVHLLGVAPIAIKGKVVGALALVGAPLSFADAADVPTLIVVGERPPAGKKILGVDVGRVAVRSSPASAFVVEPRAVVASLWGWGSFSFGPVGVEPGRVGVYGRAMALAPIPETSVLALTDVTPEFSRLASAQLGMSFAMALVALLAVGLIELGRWRVTRGIRPLADLLGRMQQNMTERAAVDERRLPEELRRLARVVNAVAVPSENVPAKTGGTIDDALAGTTPLPAVSGELEFAGLTDRPAPTPLVAEGSNDGYEPIGQLAESVLDAADDASLAAATELPSVPEALTAMEQLDAPPLVPEEEPAEATLFRSLYEKFVAARAECGESAADLTYERFVAKLEKTRDAVIAKHQCHEVNFEVYIKDGRAALRATPTR